MSSNKTLSAIVANKIENQIICGNWQVGSQIPPEQELMQTFDVSRITIREAIKTLVSRDVLEIRRGCGTFVSAVPGLSDDPLGLRFIASDDLNTYLFEARQILEPSVCRLAAQRGDAVGGLIGLREHCLDLRVEHLVHGDEVRPGHVPVSVLQDQRGLLLLAQSVLQNGNGLLGGGFVQSRHNECKCHIRSFLLGYQSPSSLSMKPARCVSLQHSYRSQ